MSVNYVARLSACIAKCMINDEIHIFIIFIYSYILLYFLLAVSSGSLAGSLGSSILVPLDLLNNVVAISSNIEYLANCIWVY